MANPADRVQTMAYESESRARQRRGLPLADMDRPDAFITDILQAKKKPGSSSHTLRITLQNLGVKFPTCSRVGGQKKSVMIYSTRTIGVPDVPVFSHLLTSVSRIVSATPSMRVRCHSEKLM